MGQTPDTAVNSHARETQTSGRDPLDGSDEADLNANGAAPVTPEDIARTRDEMSGTIAAIGEKLNPHVVAQEAKEVAADAVNHAKEVVPEIAAEVAEHAKQAINEATATAVQHVKDAATEVVDHIRETLPEVVGNVAKHAVSGAVNEAKAAVNKAVSTSKEMIGGAGHAAKGASMTIIERIKENPVPAALIGAGLFWLFQDNKSQTSASGANGNYNNGAYGSAVQTPSFSTTETGEGGTSATVQSVSYGETSGQSANYSPSSANGQSSSTGFSDKIGDAAEAAKDKAADLAGKVQDTAGSVVTKVQDTASTVAQKVSDTASTVASKVSDTTSTVATKVTDTAHQSGDWFQKTLQETPMAAVAMAVTLGTAIGLAIPETDVERRTMGETRDRLAQKAQDAAHQLGDKVQAVAQEAMTQAKTAVKETAGKVKEEAQHQGLAPQS